MTKELQVVSNFPRSIIEPGEVGVIESGTLLGGVSNEIADRLVQNGWAKVLSETPDPEPASDAAAPTDASEAPATAVRPRTVDPDGGDDDDADTETEPE